MSQKVEFIDRAMKPGARMSSLCREYGISRETGYKWLGRFKREGPDGLEEHSRRPHATPLATAEEVVAAVLELRERYPRRGRRSWSYCCAPSSARRLRAWRPSRGS
ncbi:MAG: leucine zipper domain-containing protein [Polyangiaceae bacterium]